MRDKKMLTNVQQSKIFEACGKYKTMLDGMALIPAWVLGVILAQVTEVTPEEFSYYAVDDDEPTVSLTPSEWKQFIDFTCGVRQRAGNAPYSDMVWEENGEKVVKLKDLYELFYLFAFEDYDNYLPEEYPDEKD